MKQLTVAQQKRLTQLQELLELYSHQYHTLDAPTITDEAYDSLVREWNELKGETGVFQNLKVGDAQNEAFAKVRHQVRQWSFGNAFTLSDLQDWEDRLYRQLAAADITGQTISYVAEHKIDGLKVILEYKAGVLVSAATRGDGIVGEDVTHTVRTIKDVPHTLKHAVDLQAVGEVWLGKKEFARINRLREKAGEALFANPRNAAAGSLRQLDSSVTKGRKLEVFMYDIDLFTAHTSGLLEPQTQSEELQLLQTLGLRTNKASQPCKNVAAIDAYYKKWSQKKETLDYGIDGVVVKVEQVDQQVQLGYTAKAPRFGIAFKFKAEQATTVVEDIQLQVGRTGAVTPVAHLRPVLIDGSTVSRATLHNEDQIKRLDVRVGDTIILQKAGDIIPEILEVLLELRPANTKVFKFPKKVLGCGGSGAIERVPGESAYRCVELDSDFLHRQRLYHFVSKGALNIDGVGPRIIDALLDNGLITHHYDLFTLKVGDIKDLPGFKETAAENVIAAIEGVRQVELARLLIGLSIDQIGEETARLIAQRFGTLEAIRAATTAEVAAIHGVGEVVATALSTWFADAKNTESLEQLLQNITISGSQTSAINPNLAGKSVVFTGTLPTLGRDKAKEMARQAGLQVSSSVSKKTEYVVLGDAAGSKAEKAESLGVTVLDEAAFLKLVQAS